MAKLPRLSAHSRKAGSKLRDNPDKFAPRPCVYTLLIK